MDQNKYSSSKKQMSNKNFKEDFSADFEEADNMNFNTYDEYNEDDYTFETVEEIVVEEAESE